ncbi:unnamed protein product [Schistocephalus solidus]|uniref:Fibronectin type-III domain-containing protein n=1 Tax=Schistocephalus solidus TaxID=70667 RepID=A0A183TDM8_SCHSO|nr:unnamed protein product [Schistocephalus solidus]
MLIPLHKPRQFTFDDSIHNLTTYEDALMPRNLTAVALNSTSIHVSWESPCSSIDFGYLVIFSNGTEEWKHGTTETEYTPTELKPSSTYNFTVWLLDVNGIHFGTPAYTYAITMPSGNFQLTFVYTFSFPHVLESVITSTRCLKILGFSASHAME